jgi:hypothetical protein
VDYYDLIIQWLPFRKTMVDESVTQLLLDASAGKQGAVDALFPIVYSEMHRLSASYLRKQRPGHTLQSTALVHEAYLRLIDQKVSWQSRAHFMGNCGADYAPHSFGSR